ncbi:hypothetical protein GDO78_004698 [Eleutherodactylus coqui]|uniref:BHLH domain-containing protein n=1 Tax=Eleutherodactylus coqui TaxID=57060 RepID=A0A8J6ES21_ELECQ|nr:hypothetical protein GDO78_004698 [Eleutherodactylus coqui]
MFEPTQTPPMTSSCSGSSTNVDGGVVNERATNFTPADIVDLSEMEYTQLQQLLCLHVDSQSNEGDAEMRTTAPFLPSSNATQYPSTSLTTSGSEGQNIYPVVSANNNLVPANQTLGHIDFQQLRVMMIRESGLPPPSGNVAEKHPDNTAGDSSGAGPMWVRPASDVIGLDKENENLGCISEPRTKSTVRVRLEDRFNSPPTDVPSVSPSLFRSLVTIIRHPSQLLGPQQLSKCTPIVKSKVASSSLQLLYSSFNLQNTNPGNADPSLTQANCSLNCGASCPLRQRPDTAKNPEISQSRGFSLCYKQDLESGKQSLGPRNKLPPEDILAIVGETPCVKKRRRSRVRQSDTDMERRVLSDIKNIPQGTPRPPRPEHTAEQGADNKRASLFQRKERHNRMERDRRRRIKLCCDELNNFVPFCTMVTDKATTLQWTSSFLKYIQERHGDALKKVRVFFNKSDKRRATRDKLSTPAEPSFQKAPKQMPIRDVHPWSY